MKEEDYLHENASTLKRREKRREIFAAESCGYTETLQLESCMRHVIDVHPRRDDGRLGNRLYYQHHRLVSRHLCFMSGLFIPSEIRDAWVCDMVLI